jgi:hypothetical protein
MNTLLMPFIDESESFTNGFECGQIWQMISEGDIIGRHLVHRENIEQIELICRSFGVDFGIDIADDTWAYLTVKTILNET